MLEPTVSRYDGMVRVSVCPVTLAGFLPMLVRGGRIAKANANAIGTEVLLMLRLTMMLTLPLPPSSFCSGAIDDKAHCKTVV